MSRTSKAWKPPLPGVIAAVVGIIAYGIYWLYENINTPMVVTFLATIIPPGLLALWFQRRHRRAVALVSDENNAPPENCANAIASREDPAEKEGRSYSLTLPRETTAATVGDGRKGAVGASVTDAEILSEYDGLAVSLREAVRAHDHDVAMTAATRIIGMGDTLITACARMATDGVQTDQGWIKGGSGFAGSAGFEYLTGEAYQQGKVTDDEALRYCEMAIAWTEAGLLAILAWRDKMTEELPRLVPNQAFLIRLKLKNIAQEEEDAGETIRYWRDRRTEIADKAARRTPLRDLLATCQGILQSDFLKKHPEVTSSAIYHAALRGEIIREKKGRSYLLTLPP